MRITLGSIIGAKGIPLIYVIRENDAPLIDAVFLWDQKMELLSQGYVKIMDVKISRLSTIDIKIKLPS